MREEELTGEGREKALGQHREVKGKKESERETRPKTTPRREKEKNDRDEARNGVSVCIR